MLDLNRLMFGLMYRIGFTPWDGHPLSARLRELIEGETALPAGRALDLGCGTGDTTIYLARNGWDVTAADFVEHALAKAQRKAERAGVDARFVRADATDLARYDVGDSFDLVTDNGLLHGLSDESRAAYVQQLSQVVTEGGRLLILAFGEGKRRGPSGISRAEVEQRFSKGWQLVASGIDRAASERPEDPVHFHDLRRIATENAAA